MKNVETAANSNRLAFIVYHRRVVPIRIVKKTASTVTVELAGEQHIFVTPDTLIPQTRQAARNMQKAE